MAWRRPTSPPSTGCTAPRRRASPWSPPRTSRLRAADVGGCGAGARVLAPDRDAPHRGGAARLARSTGPTSRPTATTSERRRPHSSTPPSASHHSSSRGRKNATMRPPRGGDLRPLLLGEVDDGQRRRRIVGGDRLDHHGVAGADEVDRDLLHRRIVADHQELAGGGAIGADDVEIVAAAALVEIAGHADVEVVVEVRHQAGERLAGAAGGRADDAVPAAARGPPCDGPSAAPRGGRGR